jgi:hypothetical protein
MTEVEESKWVLPQVAWFYPHRPGPESTAAVAAALTNTGIAELVQAPTLEAITCIVNARGIPNDALEATFAGPWRDTVVEMCVASSVHSPAYILLVTSP